MKDDRIVKKRLLRPGNNGDGGKEGSLSQEAGDSEQGDGAGACSLVPVNDGDDDEFEADLSSLNARTAELRKLLVQPFAFLPSLHTTLIGDPKGVSLLGAELPMILRSSGSRRFHFESDKEDDKILFMENYEEKAVVSPYWGKYYEEMHGIVIMEKRDGLISYPEFSLDSWDQFNMTAGSSRTEFEGPPDLRLLHDYTVLLDKVYANKTIEVVPEEEQPKLLTDPIKALNILEEEFLLYFKKARKVDESDCKLFKALVKPKFGGKFMRTNFADSSSKIASFESSSEHFRKSFQFTANTVKKKLVEIRRTITRLKEPLCIFEEKIKRLPFDRQVFRHIKPRFKKNHETERCILNHPSQRKVRLDYMKLAFPSEFHNMTAFD